MERSKKRARPTLEGLEGRALLNASKLVGAQVAASSNQRINYTTPDRAKVTVILTGVGTLAGTAVGPDGALNLVYAGTNGGSRIIGRVSGGSGRASLGTIRDANVSIESLTGVGAEVVGIVRLPDFDLISGGSINLLGGVNELTLRSIGSDTQVHLRDTPLNVTATSGSSSTSSSSGTATNTNTGLATGTTSGASLAELVLLDPTSRAFGGSNINATSGALASLVDTTGNGQNQQGTPGLSQAQVSNGRSNTFAVLPNRGLRLTGVGGTFVPGPNLIEPRDQSKPGPRPAPPGVVVQVGRINGIASTATPPLGDPRIFGYDPAANALIRFDAATGAIEQTLPLPVAATGSGGVALARVDGRTLVLVGVGTSVLAYDATTLAARGGFSTANLAAGVGLTTITGIATAGPTTVLVDSQAGLGVAQAIDVAASLTSPTGQAVPSGQGLHPRPSSSNWPAGRPGFPAPDGSSPTGRPSSTRSSPIRRWPASWRSPRRAGRRLRRPAGPPSSRAGRFLNASATGAHPGRSPRRPWAASNRTWPGDGRDRRRQRRHLVQPRHPGHPGDRHPGRPQSLCPTSASRSTPSSPGRPWSTSRATSSRSEPTPRTAWSSTTPAI